ncbi:hypothetical protein C8046_04345 [Serinibacter arcticus]|uniref:Uncharacterized protein n=1 Tax=Serinibacter arcticus TaxID=1655435 RepID=A0A2U1ZSQ8_9MICO|nr:hypothetical protein C8046_04345 [Serinibacter arcticus]
MTAPKPRSAPMFEPDDDARAELERQLRAYSELGVLEVLGLEAADLAARLEPVVESMEKLPTHGAWAHDPGDSIPWILVLPGMQSNALVPAMRRGAALGVSVVPDDELETYRPLEEVELPAAPYVLVGIDTGSDFCGVTPEAALEAVRERGRTPLTISEGLALTILRPDMLRTNSCYSLAGSRTGTNQRVPAVWISERRAKLGWCWDRNPHTWLGLASASWRLPV